MQQNLSPTRFNLVEYGVANSPSIKIKCATLGVAQNEKGEMQPPLLNLRIGHDFTNPTIEMSLGIQLNQRLHLRRKPPPFPLFRMLTNLTE